jgi:hypothetical protein
MSAIGDAENDIPARVSERPESQSDPLTPASAAAIARELMYIPPVSFGQGLDLSGGFF